MKKPNFFIIGAPKCGTTSLTTWLAEHPNVFMAPVKDAHYFNTDGHRIIKKPEDYEAFFAEARDWHTAIGEASVEYFHSKEAVANILTFCPDARFIVCVRNPIEMALSLYNDRRYYGEEDASSFERAWTLQTDRRAGRNVPLNARRFPERLQYGSYASFGRQLARLYDLVDERRVLVLVLDDIKSDPAGQYARTLQFLGVPNLKRSTFPIHNSRKAMYFPWLHKALLSIAILMWRFNVRPGHKIATFLKAINTKPGDPLRVPQKLHSELSEYFSEDIKLLGRLLNRDLSFWHSNNQK